jgi:hypothetical protein
MTKVGLPAPLASTCVVLADAFGAVTQQAHQRGVCRQTLYPEAAVVLAALAGNVPIRQRQQWQPTSDQLRQHVQQWQRQLAQALVGRRDQHAEFAATAQAEGVRLPVTRRL